VVETDFDLLTRWHAGDQQAGDELVRRHFRPIYRFFSSKLDEGVEDLVQRTFLGIVEARERFRREASFRTFLFEIARRQLYNHLRAKRRWQARFAPWSQSAVDLTGGPHRRIDCLEEEQLLLAALRAIPVELQIALELHYWERMPLDQIAIVLDIPQGTVKSRLFRARKQLRIEMEALSSDGQLIERTSSNLERWAEALRDRMQQKASG
jgi:RNA polymerase sigma-70 factor (ECF subfamily)